MENDFEHRSPRPEDVVKLGMIDLADGDRWIELAESRAWCWQQGCMLQWLPDSQTEVIFNDREGDRFISHILDTRTHKRRTLPGPIYSISPDRRWAIFPDFRRLNEARPGYAGIPDPNRSVPVPEDSGIWRMDLRTGERKLLFSVADIARIPYTRQDGRGAKHYFNHLLFSPDGKRFIFFHLWVRPGEPFWARMFTAKPDGGDLCLLCPGDTSHFWWRDPKHILAWAWHPSYGDKFYVFEDGTDNAQVVGLNVMTADGHCSYLPDKRWILCDTYPDRQRNQNPYLFDRATGKRYWLGHFYSPPEYRGEWRCDTHPRFSPDGRKVVIDSPHGGNGRQLYLLDISGIVT